MVGIKIKIKDGHKLQGEGESLGKDKVGNSHTFWRSSGHMEVPIDLAIKLELERPQRYEIVDRSIANSITGNNKNNISNINIIDNKVKEDNNNIKDIKEVKEDNNIINNKKIKIIEKVESVKLNYDITYDEIKSMTKDQINDWAAKRDINVKPSWLKAIMIKNLIKEIYNITGIKILKSNNSKKN